MRVAPQRGVARRVSWTQLVAWLSRPRIGASKDAAGGWCPALFRDNVRRRSNIVRLGALVFDVDDDGDVARVADAFARYRVLVHPTFSSTSRAPRCRVVVPLAEAIGAETYEQAHAVLRAHLVASGIVADVHAKDASRVSYVPVVRPGSAYDFRVLEGEQLDARAVLAAQPTPPPRPHVSATANRTHGSAYVRAALLRATGAVAGSAEGSRNATLYREARGLARLSLDDATIGEALVNAAHAAGLSTTEAKRTIVSALRARRSGP
jgi:hypothetical protein